MGLLDGFLFNILNGVINEGSKSIFSSPTLPTTSPGPIVPTPTINVMPTYESLIPFTSDTITPRRGSIIVTDLAVAFEHTGIYEGNGKIIHRSGDGYIERVSNREFIGRLNGVNPSFTSYVACIDDIPLNSSEIYNRAKDSLNDINHKQHRGYNLVAKNCHNFTRYCLTGDGDQWGFDFTFNSLQVILKYTFNVNNWKIVK